MHPHDELIKAARRYVREVHGDGCRCEEVRLVIHGERRPVLILVPRGGTTAAEPGQPDPDDQTCRDAILLTLREAGRRLTTSQLLTAMEAAGRVYGESHVKATLASLVRSGELDNRTDTVPRGYGFAGQ